MGIIFLREVFGLSHKQFFWELFVRTGRVGSYLLYKFCDDCDDEPNYDTEETLLEASGNEGEVPSEG